MSTTSTPTRVKLPKEVNRDNLSAALQQAIEIEIATIPVYLYTYYSINRIPNSEALKTQIFNDFKETQKGKKNPISDTVLKEKAEALVLKIMVFSNKSAALIMSVAVEEMLHMALSSNIKSACKIGGLPVLIDKAPSKWPTYLPGHKPEFDINRSKLTLDQLHTFLLIESPNPFKNGKGEEGNAIEYTTIGDFYSKIITCIQDEMYDEDFQSDRPQLLPKKGYYGQNNIDTIYYDKNHKPQFPNADDSGGLVGICDKASAIHAIHEIVEQGEGKDFEEDILKVDIKIDEEVSSTGKVEISAEIDVDIVSKDIKGDHLTPKGEVKCPMHVGDNKGDFDDDKREELSHFDKFLEVYCTIKKTNEELNALLGVKTFDFTKYFVKDIPTNPATSDYPNAIQKVSNLTNAIYSYLFVMTEACYKTEGHKQYEIFMFGIHKSMIWLLDSLCGKMTGLSYIDPKGEVKMATATFDNYQFSLASSPKSQIIALCKEAMKVGNVVTSTHLQRIEDLPDVALESYLIENDAPLI